MWYFLTFVVGLLCGVLFIVMVLRWGWRHQKLLTQLINEIYHEDLLNFVRRIRGLLDRALNDQNMSYHYMYLEKAMEAILELEKAIQKTVKKYEDYQE